MYSNYSDIINASHTSNWQNQQRSAMYAVNTYHCCTTPISYSVSDILLCCMKPALWDRVRYQTFHLHTSWPLQSPCSSASWACHLQQRAVATIHLQVCQKPHTYHVVCDMPLSALTDSWLQMPDTGLDLPRSNLAGTTCNNTRLLDRIIW